MGGQSRSKLWSRCGFWLLAHRKYRWIFSDAWIWDGRRAEIRVVCQQPVPGNISKPLEDLSAARSSPDRAQVGSYKSSLSSGVNVQLTATSHAATSNYAFPGSSQSTVVVDVSHILTSVGRPQWSQHYVSGNMTVLPDNNYQGSGTYNNGWNLAPDWTVYFCSKIDAPTTALTFAGNGTTLSRYSSEIAVSGKERIGAVF